MNCVSDQIEWNLEFDAGFRVINAFSFCNDRFGHQRRNVQFGFILSADYRWPCVHQNECIAQQEQELQGRSCIRFDRF